MPDKKAVIPDILKSDTAIIIVAIKGKMLSIRGIAPLAPLTKVS